MMADAADEFMKKEMWPYSARYEKKDYDIVEANMRKGGEMGLFSVTVPEEYGGMGMPFNVGMLVCDKLSKENGSFGTASGAHTGIGIGPI